MPRLFGIFVSLLHSLSLLREENLTAVGDQIIIIIIVVVNLLLVIAEDL